MIENKVCTTCFEALPATVTYFYRHKGGKLGLRSVCKKCHNNYTRGYDCRTRRERPDHATYLSAIRNIYNKYKLREGDFRKMMDEQDGCCASCGASLVNPVFSKSDLHIDHNHTTGEVRGLLCGTCNTLLGHIEKDLRRVNMLEEYILWYNRLNYGVTKKQS